MNPILTAAPESTATSRSIRWIKAPNSSSGIHDLDEVDWFSLAGHRGATKVKENAARQVWRVVLHDNEYFAKILTPRSWSDRWRQRLFGSDALVEWEALELARSRQVVAVRGVACGLRGCDSVLITEAVDCAVPLSAAWLDSVSCPNSLIRSTASLFALAHETGFVHRDSHPDNLLVHLDPSGKPQMMFVDLYGARFTAAVSDQVASLSLAKLDQWFTRHASPTQRLRFLKAYLVHRFGSKPKRAALRRWTSCICTKRKEWARRLALRRDRRLRRDGKYFNRIEQGDWRAIVVRQSRDEGAFPGLSAKLRTSAQWADLCATIVETPAEAKIHLASGLHVERHEPCFSLRGSPAWRLFCLGHKLRNRNIDCIPPVACLERRFTRLKSASLLIYGDLDELFDMRSCLTGREDCLRRTALESAGALLAEAEAAGLVWPDPKLEAFRWTKDGHAALVRFDGMRVRRSGVGRVGEISLLALAARMQLDSQDRAAMIAAYLRRRRWL